MTIKQIWDQIMFLYKQRAEPEKFKIVSYDNYFKICCHDVDTQSLSDILAHHILHITDARELQYEIKITKNYSLNWSDLDWEPVTWEISIQFLNKRYTQFSFFTDKDLLNLTSKLVTPEIRKFKLATLDL